jgi:RND family efflux transporter MFP subunit
MRPAPFIHNGTATNSRRPWQVVGLATLVAFALAACGASESGGGGSAPTAAANAIPAIGASAPAVAGPPVSVSTVMVKQRDIPVEVEATGAVAALSTVDIKPQVASIITRVHVKEGQFVKRGEPLFSLDARADEANLSKARAQLQKDEAALVDAQRQLARSRELLSKNFIAQGAVDTTQAAVDSAIAATQSDRAAIEAAQVALSYDTITAPGAGRLGVLNAFAGSFVQPSGTAPLVTLTQLDPISVSFSVPQRYLGDLLPLLQSGNASVEANLPDASGKPRVGRMQFVDNVVDPASGTVKVKAQFDNKDQALWPGAFVNVKLRVQTLKNATVVPQAAIIESPRGKIVYVVDASSKVAPRSVSLLYAAGIDAAITGLNPGERVVVDGRQNLRNGSSVVDRGNASVAAGGAAGGASSANAGKAPTSQ